MITPIMTLAQPAYTGFSSDSNPIRVLEVTPHYRTIKCYTGPSRDQREQQIDTWYVYVPHVNFMFSNSFDYPLVVTTNRSIRNPDIANVMTVFPGVSAYGGWCTGSIFDAVYLPRRNIVIDPLQATDFEKLWIGAFFQSTFENSPGDGLYKMVYDEFVFTSKDTIYGPSNRECLNMWQEWSKTDRDRILRIGSGDGFRGTTFRDLIDGVKYLVKDVYAR